MDIRLLKKFCLMMVCILTTVGTASCSSDDEPMPPPQYRIWTRNSLREFGFQETWRRETFSPWSSRKGTS